MTNLIAEMDIATLKGLAFGGTVAVFAVYCVIAMAVDYVTTKFKNRRK